MSQRLTPSQENYLEHIFRLAEQGPVRMGDIASAAGVRLPSVTRAVGKLVDAGLVTHQAYGTVEITARGLEAARDVDRRDSCLQSLLVDVLDMNEEDAKGEVCRLEHVVSAEVLSRLEVLVRHAASPAAASWRAGLQRKLGRRKLSKSSPRTEVGGATLHAAPRKTR